MLTLRSNISDKRGDTISQW